MRGRARMHPRALDLIALAGSQSIRSPNRARRSETTDYVAAEAEAKEKKLGLWQGEFMMPDAFRRAAGIFVERP
jgi:endonuclease YncB( thermonuclease family)